MKILYACASLLAVSACAPTVGEMASTEMASTMAADATPTTAMPYVAMAGSSDMYEIESSRLALQRATSPAIKQFAQMMIDHHTATTQQVMQAARAAGMTPPPPSLLPPQRAMMETLQPLTGAAFERMYVQQQRTAHNMALELHQSYARAGDTAQLRTAANAAVPIIQSHIRQLAALPSS